MSERRAFQDRQYAFAAHIRDPDGAPAPAGIEDRRIAIYRDLFFNNLRNLLGRTFPVMKKIHSGDRWDHFIRGFMRQHRARTPYFLELPAEFVDYLKNEYQPAPDDYPFLAELAHYEYIELALSVSTESDDPDTIDADGDLLNEVPVKSALAWLFAYRYPVHKISTGFLPTEALQQPVYIVVYRNREDTVGFLELNPASAELLNAIDINDAGNPGEQLLRDVAGKVGYADVPAFIQHGLAAMQQMRDLDIIIGTRPPGRHPREHQP